MIISFRKNFLFVHIPKCAGESITELLLEAHNSGGQFLLKHSTYSHAERVLGKEIFRFTSFAVIRNPYAQVFSFYRHLCKSKWMDVTLLERQYPGSRGRLQPRIESEIAMSCEFSEYVRKCYSDTAETHIWMRDLCSWLTDAEGKIAISHVLRYENLYDDIRSLSQRLSLDGVLQWRNSSRCSATEVDYRVHYDITARDIIKKHFRRTLDAFGYVF